MVNKSRCLWQYSISFWLLCIFWASRWPVRPFPVLWLASVSLGFRPPGHHAQYNNMDGYCMFNTVGIAAQYVRQKLGFERWVMGPKSEIQVSCFQLIGSFFGEGFSDVCHGIIPVPGCSVAGGSSQERGRPSDYFPDFAAWSKKTRWCPWNC